MFWIYTVLLFLLAALFVLLPLWLRARVDEEDPELRKQANVALFQERSDELEADFSAGNIDQQQFDTLLAELQRGLLADVELSKNPKAPRAAGKKTSAKKQGATSDSLFSLTYMAPAAFVVLLPILAYGLYNQWGYIDDVQVMDLFQRTVDNQGDAEEARELIITIGEFAQANPEMPWAFYFLAENFAAIGLFEQAQIAYQRAAELLEETPEKALVLGRVAMSMYINSEFEFSDEVLSVIEQAREINPNEMSVLQLLAADAEQREDFRDAIDYWRLMIQVNPNSEFAQELRFRISAAQQLLSQDEGASLGPSVDVSVNLADNLTLDPNLRVFIAARNADQEGMPPLAAVDTTVGALPTTIRLDNSSAVGPFNLASAATIYVSVLVSNRGVATPSPGDYREVSENFSPNGQHTEIALTVSERLP